jgi:hypothetical protein
VLLQQIQQPGIVDLGLGGGEAPAEVRRFTARGRGSCAFGRCPVAGAAARPAAGGGLAAGDEAALDAVGLEGHPRDAVLPHGLLEVAVAEPRRLRRRHELEHRRNGGDDQDGDDIAQPTRAAAARLRGLQHLFDTGKLEVGHGRVSRGSPRAGALPPAATG